MLDEHKVTYRYREYTQETLSEDEIRTVLRKLGMGPRKVLRTGDKAFRALGLTGNEPDDELIAHMAAHPTLLQRPIGILGDKAIVGRPPTKLLDLID